MSKELGRISGSMLKANLERLGVDLAFETDLLYLDVNSGKIGVSTDVVPRELTINGTLRTTDLIIDGGNLTVTGDLQLNGNTGEIQTISGDPITINPQSKFVNLDELKTPNIRIFNNFIEDITSNESFILRASGTGIVSFSKDVDVSGDLHSVGDITFNGTIGFGDSTVEDAITINAEIDSNIMPANDFLYNVGSPTKKWKELHSKLLNGEYLQTSQFAVPSVTDIATRPGKTWYVSAENGLDTNVGDHQSGPFATIKHALSQATSGDTVYIYAGNYEEYFPLTVPQGVTVSGEGIRSVKIFPHTSNNDKDAFLLNGETTVENLTVSDFYYNSTNNTGYGFRFANNIEVTSRSPYVRNITVLTSSDSSTASAGRGALVDGSAATSNSIEASMLFHSVTFITPGNISLYMTNGVRVEWLNSFTYFASKGLYATNGAVGRLTPDGSTIKKGAELRAIGSANVYGDSGAEADGNECLMYLINHNFAYIGAGTNVNNDPTTVDQSFETSEANGGKIYFQSIDQGGNFRVGDAFVVDQATGFVTLNGVGIGAGGVDELAFSDGTNSTIVNPFLLQTGSIILRDNEIITDSGDLNIDPTTLQTTLDSDVTVQDNLTVDGDMIVNGAVTLGDSSQQGTSTTVSFNAPISIDLEPTLDKTYNIGSDAASWKVLYTNKIDLDDLSLFQNKISTTTSSSNLELEAAGTGNIQLNSNLLSQFGFSIGDSDLQNVDITGSLIQTGNQTVTGNRTVTGNYTLTGFLELNDIDVPFDAISIEGNRIRATESNSNLELQASGSGKVILDSNAQTANVGFSVVDTIETNSLTAGSTITADIFATDGLEIFQDNIVGLSNADIELRTTGTTDKIVIDDNLDILLDLNATSGASLTFLQTSVTGAVSITGTSNLTGTTQLSGNGSVSGDITADSLFLDDISIDNNVVTTTSSNSDLELRAAGTGKVVVPENNVEVTNTIDIKGAFNFGSLTAVSSVGASEFYTDDILFKDNYITSTQSNSNLELRASGTGTILLSENNLQIDNNLTVSTTSDLKTSSITGSLLHTGDKNHTGDVAQTGNINLTGNAIIDGYFQLDDIRFETNYVSTTSSNSDLELRASGTGKVVVNNNDVIITENLTVVNQIYADDASITNTLTFDRIDATNIVLDGNLIRTTDSNSDLEITASGSGSVVVQDSDIIAEQTTTFNNISIFTDLTATGTQTVNANINQTGNYETTNNFNVNGKINISELNASDIRFTFNRIENTALNQDLTFEASGTGNVVIEGTDVVASQNFTVDGIVSLNGELTVGRVIFNSISTGDILVDDNFITTTYSNSNLELRANGLGIVLLPNNDVVINNDLRIFDGNTTLSNTEIVDLTHVGDFVQAGNYTQTGTFTVAGGFYGNDSQFENIRFINNRITTTDSNSDLELKAINDGDIIFNDVLRLGRTFEANILEVPLVTSTQVQSSELNTDDIQIKNDTIRTTLSNSPLEFRSNTLIADELKFNDNTISVDLNFVSDNIIFQPSGNLKINGNITLPIGTSSQSPDVVGGIRYNNQLGKFTGFTSDEKPFGGVYSSNLLTNIVASNEKYFRGNGVISFTAAGILTAEIDSTGITLNGLTVDDLNLNGNIITSTQDTDINITPSGTGDVILDDIIPKDNTFENQDPNNPLIVRNTQDGYVKFDSTTGVRIPTGDDSQRSLTPQVGEIRFNIESGSPEVYNGSGWATWAGQSVTATEQEIDDLATIYGILLG